MPVGQHGLVLGRGKHGEGILRHIGSTDDAFDGRVPAPEVVQASQRKTRARMRRADDAQEQRAGGRYVGTEFLGAGEFCRPVQACHAAAHRGTCRRAIDRVVRSRDRQYRFDDLPIAGAAAQHPSQGITDRGFVRIRVAR